MPGELVRAGKPPPAILPVADERPLSGVGAIMSFQVRGFEVVLAATLVRAFVHPSSDRRLNGGLRRRQQYQLSRDQFAVGTQVEGAVRRQKFRS